MKQSDIKTWTPGTNLLVVLMLLGGAAAVYRLGAGLGASTNLGDSFPWGMWLGIDVLGGVAMAAGGFMIASLVYVFHLEKYRPVVRPAILTAFLGYLLAIVALLLDIGQPHRLWHPAIMWQVHSVMWVVGIHVILYTTTLALEFSPMLFQRLGMTGAVRAVHKIIVPVVIFGALLSVLHQSSLGAVFLISEGRMSPLWYSPEIPKLFLVSALMMGFAMVSLETMLSSRAFKHEVDPSIHFGLARMCLWVTGFYFVYKLYTLAVGPGIGAAFAGTTEANMYLLEMIVGVVLPIVLLLGKGAREKLSTVLTVDILVIVGVVLNRLNVSIFGLYRDSALKGAKYFPSLMEFAVTIALVSMAIFLFKMAAKHLPLLDSGTEAEH
ncbi:MAG: NrfD/PsrC family molybdoenzyme membrane anchor subunit [Candidatus Methylomirabilia bacterium]